MIKHMTTMNETIALLSGMAPKEPEQWAVDEWMDGFKKDYPKPMDFKYPTATCFLMVLLGREPKSQSAFDWMKTKNKAYEKWIELEWPIIWARKRLELVNETSKG